MATFTLDDIRDAADKQFASLDIPLSGDRILRLRNPLRLTSEERAELTAVQTAGSKERERIKALAAEYRTAVEAHEADPENAPDPGTLNLPEVDQFGQLAKILTVVANDRTLCQELLNQLGGDVTLIATVVQQYNKVVEPGEA